MMDEAQAQIAEATVTALNHPENRIEPVLVAREESRLLRSIALSILGGMIGMIVGVAALSSTLMAGELRSFLSLLPLVVMLVALEAGYFGAMFWMCEEEGENGSGA